MATKAQLQARIAELEQRIKELESHQWKPPTADSWGDQIVTDAGNWWTYNTAGAAPQFTGSFIRIDTAAAVR